MTAEEAAYGEEVHTRSPALFLRPQAARVIGPHLPIWKKEERGGSLIKAWHSACLAQAVFIIQS